MHGAPVFGSPGPLGFAAESDLHDEPLGGSAHLEEPPPPAYDSVVLQSTVVRLLPCRRPLPPTAAGAAAWPCVDNWLAVLPHALQVKEPASTSGRPAGSGTYGVRRQRHACNAHQVHGTCCHPRGTINTSHSYVHPTPCAHPS